LEPAIDLVFNYLRDILYSPDEASLDINKLPKELKELGQGLIFFARCVLDTKYLAYSLSKGDLDVGLPPKENEIAAPLKSLHASLKHLTWQTQQIAQGNYKQRVDFMGEFSVAFNSMVEQLDQRQQQLEGTINQVQQKNASLEHSNLFLNLLMNHVPMQIIVIDSNTHEVLLMNETALTETANNAKYVEEIIQLLFHDGDIINGNETTVKHVVEGHVRYLSIRIYFLEWYNIDAQAIVINDVSDVNSKLKELEKRAYEDDFTQLHNRAFGMMALDKLLSENRLFVLIFADLDSLKYINDEFGHSEGDMYILNATGLLKALSPNVIACRIGGDEFMVILQNVGYDEAHDMMTILCDKLCNHIYLNDKPYQYSISFGIVAVESDNNLSAGEILSMADERMYENKQMRKKKNRNTQDNI